MLAPAHCADCLGATYSRECITGHYKFKICVCVCVCVCIYIYIYIYMFQNVFLRCPTPRLHCFLSSHWPSFSFLSFMAFLIPSIQFFFGLPLVPSFVSASTSMLFWVIFLLPFSEHGRTMQAKYHVSRTK